MKITRYEYGDIAADSDGPMTVADLISALKKMPPGAVVYRYFDWTVETVLFEHHENGDGKVELH